MTPTPTPPVFGQFIQLASGNYFLLLRTWDYGDLFLGFVGVAVLAVLLLRWAYDLARRGS